MWERLAWLARGAATPVMIMALVVAGGTALSFTSAPHGAALSHLRSGANFLIIALFVCAVDAPAAIRAWAARDAAQRDRYRAVGWGLATGGLALVIAWDALA